MVDADLANLVAAVRGGDAASIPVLCDRLEEIGDARLHSVRPLRVCYYNDGGTSYWWVSDGQTSTSRPEPHLTPDRAERALCRRIAALFLEYAPRLYLPPELVADALAWQEVRQAMIDGIARDLRIPSDLLGG